MSNILHDSIVNHLPSGTFNFVFFCQSCAKAYLVLLNLGNWMSVSEKAMAPHSSTLAWKIPWMEEPGRLKSMGSLRVGHD